MRDFTAATQWWAEAGVDCIFTDEAQEWLGEPEQEEAPAEEQRRAERAKPMEPEKPKFGLGGDPAQWPTDLETFRKWWLEEASLDDGDASRRVPPRGNAKPALMVIVPEPEECDRDALLSGPEGELLASFLKNAGVDPERTYVASALPRRHLMADWVKIGAEGMDPVVMHHIRLVEPERVLILGRAVVELVKDKVNANRELELSDRAVPILSGLSLDNLIKHPKRRKALWSRWLEWTGSE